MQYSTVNSQVTLLNFTSLTTRHVVCSGGVLELLESHSSIWTLKLIRLMQPHLSRASMMTLKVLFSSSVVGMAHTHTASFGPLGVICEPWGCRKPLHSMGAHRLSGSSNTRYCLTVSPGQA